MNFKEGEVLAFYKPLGWTSFALVNKVRWMMCQYIGEKKLKVGHAGTLDPLATGVLIVCTGKKTKEIDTFQYQTKEYTATLQLGSTTPSFDLEKEIDHTFPTSHINQELIDKLIPTFVGEIWQIPPVFSAVKVDGKRAYDYARKGQEVEIKPKLLVIDEIEVLAFEQEKMELQIRVVCSKGTYIRALARDIGLALQSGAHLTALKRTRIGDTLLANCMTIEEFESILNEKCTN